ncbi:MAG: gliding motility-associated C-terminal domain-containing protein [Bacteroidota bacterium]
MKTKTILLLALLIINYSGNSGSHCFAQNIGINTAGATPHASAILDIDVSPENNKGFLVPRMTTVQGPIASPAITTTYYVTATDTNGCISTDSVKVTVTEYYFIPNVFSPNNDGLNDLFELKAEGFKTYHAEIYNRWGEKMFETTDSKVHWNGRNISGNVSANGVYFYILYLSNYKDEPKTLKGFLTIVR